MNKAKPEQIFAACTTLEKEGEYNLVEECYGVLIDKFRPETLLPQLLASCEGRAPMCNITVLGSYGDIEKCTPLKKDFNMTVDGTIHFPFYDSCIDLAKSAPARRTVYEALAQKRQELCKTLEIPTANVCLFRMAQKTSNTRLCDDIIPLSNENFTLREFCKCASPQEPTVLCQPNGLPGYTKNITYDCRVLENNKILVQMNLTELDQVRPFDLEMRYAPCRTSFKYSIDRNMHYKYNLSIS